MADVGEGRDVEVACMNPLLDQRMRCRLDHRARSSCFQHAGEPSLHLRRFGRRLAADVVDLPPADLEGDRAHCAGHDSAGLEHVLGHVRDGGLAIGAGDARELEASRRPAVELRRQLGKPDSSGWKVQHRNSRRDFDVAFERQGDGSFGDGVGEIHVAVDVQTLHRDEQVPFRDAARVVRDARNLDIAVALQDGPGPAGKVRQPHRPQDNRVVIAEIGGRRFAWASRTYVMGIVNVTPDSFSGDGLGQDVDAAVAQGVRMVSEGADMLDVGGESTRPGHVPVPALDEISRTETVVRRLARESGVPVSIDTYKQEVAEVGIAAGAAILNDVWGLTRSPAIADLAARHGCALVVMHNQDGTQYSGDLMDEIKRFLVAAAARAIAAGVPKEKVIVDPGIGFGKTADQSWEVMRRFSELKALGHPVLVGTSRKSFIGKLLDLPVTDRLEGTTATVVGAVLRGADIVRVHDVKQIVRAVRVADRMR